MCVLVSLKGFIWRDCLILLSLCVLQACEPQRLGTPRPSLASAVIQTVLDHASSVETFVDPKQPLLVDVQSFVNASRSAPDAAVTAADVENAVAGPLHNVTRAAAVRCWKTPWTRNCRIRSDALLIQLDSMSLTSTGLEAVATYFWTDRRDFFSSGIGWTRLRIYLHRSGEEWVVRGTRIEGMT